jgi:mono/diheme cytochrome c family protein
LRQLPHKFPRKAQALKLAFAALLLSSAAAAAGQGAAPGGAVAADRVAAKRGAYLAAAAGCGACHTDTKHGGQPFAGGRAFETAFGTIISPNITPDRETGIGKWRRRDLTASLRWGIASDDSHFLTTFPFPYYNRLSERDIADLETFLDTVPPVRQANRANQRTPFAAAVSATAVAAMPFPGAWQPDAHHDAAWNRGAYLVATVGRCGDCHSRRDWLGVADPNRFLAGAPAGRGSKAAPNITPEPKTGIGTWSIDDVVNLLKTGQKPDFDFVGGPMGEIVDNTSKLTDDDRRAIAVYLKSLPPLPAASPRSAEKG